MKPFRLMHLIRHLTHNTACPSCNAEIFAENIHVDTALDDSAFLTIHCSECKQSLSAHVYVNLSDPEIIRDSQQHESEIAENEIEFAHTILENHTGSVSNLFTKRI